MPNEAEYRLLQAMAAKEDPSLVDALVGGGGGYGFTLDSVGEGARAASEYVPSPWAFLQGAASMAPHMLPGAGLVDAYHAYDRAKDEWKQGNYLRAAAHYAGGLVDQGTEMLGVTSALPSVSPLLGMFLPAAKLAETDMLYKLDLDDFRRLQSQGMDARELWKRTGIYDHYGTPMAEISDSGMKLKKNYKDVMKRMDYIDPMFDAFSGAGVKMGKYGDIIDHPDLYRHMPEIQDIDLILGPGALNSMGSGKAAYLPGKNRIVVDTDQVPLWKATGDGMGVLGHETTHFIDDANNLPRGGGAGSDFPKVKGADTPTEVIEVKGRPWRFLEEKTKLSPDEVRNLVDELGSVNPKVRIAARGRLQQLMSKKDYEAFLQKHDRYLPTLHEGDIGRQAMRGFGTNALDYDQPFEFYYRGAGEAHARNVGQNRFELSPRERRATFPEDTLDIPKNRQWAKYSVKKKNGYPEHSFGPTKYEMTDKIAPRTTPGGVQWEFEDAPTIERAKKIVGAPYGVMSKADEAKLRRGYMKDMEIGMEGRGWYRNAGQSNLRMAGDDPLQAARITGAQAATSSQTSVDQNLGYAIRAHNQAMMGEPLEAGRFPTAMQPRLEKVYGADSPGDIFEKLGPKVGPYGENIALGGGFQTNHQGRPVHDLWDMRAWGYDPGQMAGGASPQMHKWMDDQAARVIRDANRKKLGGFDDWDELTAQETAWVGRRAQDESTPLGTAAKSYSDYWDKYMANGSYETVPGSSTDHLAALRDVSYDAKKAYHEGMNSILKDSAGRDRIALAYGAMTDAGVDGPGYFNGNISPGTQARYAMGRAKGGESADTASRKMAEAIENTRGILLGQDGIAYHYGGNAGAKVSATGMADIDLGEALNEDSVIDIMSRVEKFNGAAGNVVPIPTKDGVRLLNIGMDPDEFSKMTKGVAKEIGAPSPVRRQNLAPGYAENDWRTAKSGQSYAQAIEPIIADMRPDQLAKANRELKKIAEGMLEFDRGIMADLGSPSQSQIQRVREVIAESGISGLIAAIRNGAVPAFIGLAVLQMALPRDAGPQEM